MKPAGADTLADNEGQEETNKEDDSQTLKPADKKPVQKCSNRASSGSQDGPVSYDKDILAKGQKTKYPKDHISINCIQRAGYFSCILLICSKIARRCQTSTSTLMLLWSMDPLYRVVSGQVYPGTLTHPKLELPHEICLGSLKYTMHSSQEFVPSRTFQTDCILLTISGFKKPVTSFHYGVHMSHTHCLQSGGHVPWLLV